jgi:hypothetical protein
MSYAIVLRETGGPEKLRYEAVAVADPGPGDPHMQSQAVAAASQGFSASLVPVQFEKHRQTLEATPGETETEELLIDETAKRGR